MQQQLMMLRKEYQMISSHKNGFHSSNKDHPPAMENGEMSSNEMSSTVLH